MHRNNLLLFEKHCLPYFQPGQKVLELGPGSVPSPYLSLIAAKVGPIDYYCADVNNRRLGRQISRMPPPLDGVTIQHIEMVDDITLKTALFFDVIVSGSVLCWVRRPWKWIAHLASHLTPGGLLMTISNVSWRRAPVGGFDGWRVFPDGLRVLYEEAGLEVLVVGP